MCTSREAKIADAFMVVGAQYFATARRVAVEFVMPLSGILYHHAIELFLKACLVPSLSVKPLKALGHDLGALWDAWRTTSQGAPLAGFDNVVKGLDRFERIRYPDKIVDERSAIGISLGGPGPSLVDAMAPTAPKYKLNVEELDDLVIALFRASSTPLSPYFGQLPDVLRTSLPAPFTDGK